MKKILVIHGPNLNLLGEREPDVYGDNGIDNLNNNIVDRSKALGLECEIFQSNHEGAIIDKLHSARKNFDGVVINAGAYTHYSYAIRDAISAIKIPCIEVHISNVDARDAFRANSVIAPVCKGSISGFGFGSYYLAVQALSEMYVWNVTKNYLIP
ncbi:MAG: type II 3-dehydroquinate dehydratase [Ruminococcus sp.]|nr:type II 3-dehydroquinate dehydratase [Ruminococcus sp.]